MKPTKSQLEMAKRRIVLSIVTQRCSAYWDRKFGVEVDVASDLRQSRDQAREVMIGLRALRDQK